MANSVSSIVKSIINSSPFITETLMQEVISFSNLAKFIQPKVEAQYGQKVNLSAIVMATRRYAEELKKGSDNEKSRYKMEYDISMKTGIYDVNLTRTDSFIAKLSQLYDRIHPDKGDFLNITLGSNEISLAVSEKYRAIIDELVSDQMIVHRSTGLVAITILFYGDFFKTPGLLYLAIKQLAWENINIYEIVSTMNDLTFVINREDSLKAYEALQTFMEEGI